MVLEKEQLQQKQVSEPHNEVDSEGSDGAQKIPGTHFEKAGIDEGKKLFKESNKKKMKMSWENIVISAIPRTKKCGRAIVPVPQPKVILNDVSGTVFPGQFLAIIGASGKLIIECSVYNLPNRCWKDYSP